jgi:hypothetical protein
MCRDGREAMKTKPKNRSEVAKSNITLKLGRELLREIKILAAKENTSISALVTTHIGEIVKKRKGSERARARALARLREGYDLGFAPVKSRDELYER